MPDERTPGHGAEALELRIRLVEDRQQIHDVLMRYCRGVDRGDPDLIVSAFHDDATDNHFGITLPFREAIGTLRDPLNGPTHRHNLCNEYVEIDGDVAHGESYFMMTTRLEQIGDGVDWNLQGRYVDRFERREGTWRIATRTVIYDLQRFDPIPAVPDGVAGNFLAKALRGARGTTDWSYNEMNLNRAAGAVGDAR